MRLSSSSFKTALPLLRSSRGAPILQSRALPSRFFTTTQPRFARPAASENRAGSNQSHRSFTSIWTAFAVLVRRLYQWRTEYMLTLTDPLQAIATSSQLLQPPTFHFLDSSASDAAVGSALISYDEVQKHTSAEDCWVIINVRDTATRSRRPYTY